MGRVFLIDIDGTICEDIKNEESHLYPSAEVYTEALKDRKSTRLNSSHYALSQ
jgi:hypothetical protein